MGGGVSADPGRREPSARGQRNQSRGIFQGVVNEDDRSGHTCSGTAMEPIPCEGQSRGDAKLRLSIPTTPSHAPTCVTRTGGATAPPTRSLTTARSQRPSSSLSLFTGFRGRLREDEWVTGVPDQGYNLGRKKGEFGNPSGPVVVKITRERPQPCDSVTDGVKLGVRCASSKMTIGGHQSACGHMGPGSNRPVSS
jgi:hypothetical protein